MKYLYGQIIFERQRNQSDGNALRTQRRNLRTRLEQEASNRGLIPLGRDGYPNGITEGEGDYTWTEAQPWDGVTPKAPPPDLVFTEFRIWLYFSYAHQDEAVIDAAADALNTYLAGSRWANGILGTTNG